MTNRPSPEPKEDTDAERLEVAVDANLNRMLRSSRRPDQQIVIGRQAWSAFLARIRAGQDY